MTTLTVEIPEQLMFQLNDTGDPVQEIVIKALEFYLDLETANRRKKSQLKDTKTQRHKEKKIYPGL
ncbi:MAG: hypothetical protein RLZZ338_1283 [Cyanobacteriota bacterium]|jgi:hypothetical protein